MPDMGFYPDADPETTSVDGYVSRDLVDETFATIRAGAGNAHNDTVGDGLLVLTGTATPNQYSLLSRFLFLFNTSTIPAGAVVTAATLSLWGLTKRNAIGEPDLVIVGSTPASNTALVDADYTQLGTAVLGSMAYADFVATDSAYNTIALNDAGRGAISLTGITKLGARLSWDRDNAFTGTWSEDSSYFRIRFADDVSGTAVAPKLTVTYSLLGRRVLVTH